jgi:hypothetical protein
MEVFSEIFKRIEKLEKEIMFLKKMSLLDRNKTREKSDLKNIITDAYLKDQSFNKSDLAKSLGVSRQYVYKIVWSIQDSEL